MNRRRFFRQASLSVPLIAMPNKSRLGGAGAVNPELNQFSDFDAQAFAALPIEERYDFAEVLAEGAEEFQRDPSAQPAPDEWAIPASGWKLVVPSGTGKVLREAAERFSRYLARAMQVKVTIEPRASLANWQGLEGVIVAAPRGALPGSGAALKGSKDYEIQVSPQRVVVSGFDERGAMYGLYNLEARMNLREAPFLPRNLKTVRHSLCKTRMTLTGVGYMEWPDEYLALLPRYGFDSIFASVYKNPNGAPADRYFGTGTRPGQDPARVRDLIDRAARYGIDLYCQVIYHWLGTPESEQGLRKLVRDIVTEFPEVRGYILLTEGFWYDTWFGAGGQKNIDLRDWVKNWAKGVAVVCDECHKINPALEVLAWDYNIDFRPSQVDVKRYVITQLPADSIPFPTFENGKSFTLDGEEGYLRDYSISQIGPAEVTEAQIAEARRRGMHVYSKADTWASWQFGTFPYLPFPYQWYARYQALAKYGIEGTLESWSYGFKPNFIAELRAWYSWSDAPPLDELLRAMARRDFGAGSEDDVLQSWKHFSDAIRLDPSTGPAIWGNTAIASPLFFEKPNPCITTHAHSWTDEAAPGHDRELDPSWPFLPRHMIFTPDFTNRVNKAEQAVRPFSLTVFSKYLQLFADGMEQGLMSYRRAALAAPESKRKGAFRRVLLAEQIKRMAESARAILEFENLRFRLNTGPSSQPEELLDQMTVILRDEISRTSVSLEATHRDSRIGYEWESDYFYTPEAIEAKICLMQRTLDEYIPAYRKRHGITP